MGIQNSLTYNRIRCLAMLWEHLRNKVHGKRRNIMESHGISKAQYTCCYPSYITRAVRNKINIKL